MSAEQPASVVDDAARRQGPGRGPTRSITVDWWAGTGYRQAVDHLLRCATALGTAVDGEFNGRFVRAHPDGRLDDGTDEATPREAPSPVADNAEIERLVEALDCLCPDTHLDGGPPVDYCPQHVVGPAVLAAVLAAQVPTTRGRCRACSMGHPNECERPGRPCLWPTGGDDAEVTALAAALYDVGLHSVGPDDLDNRQIATGLLARGYRLAAQAPAPTTDVSEEERAELAVVVREGLRDAPLHPVADHPAPTTDADLTDDQLVEALISAEARLRRLRAEAAFRDGAFL